MRMNRVLKINGVAAAITVITLSCGAAKGCGGSSQQSQPGPTRTGSTFTACKVAGHAFRHTSTTIYADVYYGCIRHPQSLLIAAYLDYRQNGVWHTVASDQSSTILMLPHQKGLLQPSYHCLAGEWKVDVYYGGVTKSGVAVKATQRASYRWHVSSCKTGSLT